MWWMRLCCRTFSSRRRLGRITGICTVVYRVVTAGGTVSYCSSRPRPRLVDNKLLASSRTRLFVDKWCQVHVNVLTFTTGYSAELEVQILKQGQHIGDMLHLDTTGDTVLVPPLHVSLALLSNCTPDMSLLLFLDGLVLYLDGLQLS